MSASSDAYEGVRVRLEAYIWPHAPVTDAQKLAFEQAVEAQVRFEEKNSEWVSVPSDVQGYSIGNYSVNYSGLRNAGYSQKTICPTAWAYLFNAGLLKGALPQARRL